MNNVIPQNEVSNILSIYWQMLQEIEANTNPEKDPLNKLLVEGAYKVLNRAGISEQKPRWIKKDFKI